MTALMWIGAALWAVLALGLWALIHGSAKQEAREQADPTPEPDEDPDVVELTTEEWAALVAANPSVGQPADCTPDCPCTTRAQALLAEVNRVQQDPLPAQAEEPLPEFDPEQCYCAATNNPPCAYCERGEYQPW